MFPKKENVQQALDTEFFERMSYPDILARNSVSKESYLKHYKNGIQEFTSEEQKILEKHVLKINKLCIPFQRFLRIPWNFVKFQCCDIEQGYPHTLGKFIFLPANFFTSNTDTKQRETIIHEKIHIYQRIFTLQTNLLIIKFWNYQLFDLKSKIPLIRNNPDTNNILYERNGSVVYQKYKSYTPSSLQDSYLDASLFNTTDKVVENHEHPYEKMAYNIADIINNNNINGEDYIETMQWMKQYF